jgi:hypothetical protein
MYYNNNNNNNNINCYPSVKYQIWSKYQNALKDFIYSNYK